MFFQGRCSGTSATLCLSSFLNRPVPSRLSPGSMRDLGSPQMSACTVGGKFRCLPEQRQAAFNDDG